MNIYRTGMDVLMDEHVDLLEGRRVGLICHPASMNRLATHSAVLLRERIGERLTCLLGPEHGFFGHAAAGERIAHDIHPEWRIPIYSLYGEAEGALQQMAERVDTLIFDLQDLGVRCYTYVHTLRQVMEAAERHGIRLIVTDRPIPASDIVDGPLLDSAFESIVAPVATPLVYGMTPGETARWLTAERAWTLDLHVVPAHGYRRAAPRESIWPDWIAPSPAIRSWDCAMCFPVTVFTEALPQLDCARTTTMAFRVLRARWLDATALVERMNTRSVRGVLFAPYHDVEESNLSGIQLRVTNPRRFRPIELAVMVLYELQALHGVDVLWGDPNVRTDWFDKLMGTDQVRLMLQDGESPERIIASWQPARALFEDRRKAALLYAG